MAVWYWPKYEHLFGTDTDAAVARMIGCSHSAVKRQREKRGIAAYQRPRATKPARRSWREKYAAVLPDLGQYPDKQVAEIHGISSGVVRSLRQRSGIPACGHSSRRPEWYDLLGTMTDEALAAKVGLSRQRIFQARTREGIIAFAKNPKIRRQR
jgi:hypothetical protein